MGDGHVVTGYFCVRLSDAGENVVAKNAKGVLPHAATRKGVEKLVHQTSHRRDVELVSCDVIKRQRGGGVPSSLTSAHALDKYPRRGFDSQLCRKPNRSERP